MDELLPLFASANIEIEADFYDKSTRKLQFATNLDWLSFVVVRAFDVSKFVQNGVCDVGVCGSDVLDEFEGENTDIISVADLNIGHCRLSVAKRLDVELAGLNTLHVASKYVNIASKFFTSQGLEAKIIKLGGSMELAAKLGLCDVIVDLVSTGKTLLQNNMHEISTISKVQSKLICNKTTFRIKNQKLNNLLHLIFPGNIIS